MLLEQHIEELMAESFLPLHVFALAAALYFALAWPASILARYVEERLHAPGERLSVTTASLTSDGSRAGVSQA